MSIRRVVPDIGTERMDESRAFYIDFLGFQLAMDMGWIVTLVSPTNPTAQISLLQGPLADTRPMPLTIEVADVNAVHARAAKLGIKIDYPLTDEPWGVRRFAVTDPNGVVINVMMHLK
jgi:catechol 2,3-dioxygenase-like lactoylglutathione lyase family enzyme